MLLRIFEKTSVRDLIKWLAVLAILSALILGVDFIRTVYAGQKSKLEENWGKSFEAAKNNQILNPDAGKRLEPVRGMDGVAAEKAMQTYRYGKKTKKSSGEYGILTIKK